MTTAYHCQPTRQRTRRAPRSLTAPRPPVRAAASSAAMAGIQVHTCPRTPSGTPEARGIHAKELALVGAAGRVAGYHLVALCYLIYDSVGEVGNGVAEPCDLLLHRVRSPYLSGLGVGIVADEVGIEDLIDYL